MDWDDLAGIFRRKQPTTFLSVTEGSQGIQTYLNPLIRQFNKAYKEQLISFLKGVISELEARR